MIIGKLLFSCSKNVQIIQALVSKKWNLHVWGPIIQIFHLRSYCWNLTFQPLPSVWVTMGGITRSWNVTNSQIWEYTFANLEIFTRFQNYSQFRLWYLTAIDGLAHIPDTYLFIQCIFYVINYVYCNPVLHKTYIHTNKLLDIPC